VTTLVGGPAVLHDGGDRPIGVAAAVGFERGRPADAGPGLTWRAEFAVISAGASEARAELEGPLRPVGFLAHAEYVVPGEVVSP